MRISVERNDICLAKARKLSILPTELDTFDIRQHSAHILYLYTNFKKNVFFSVYRNVFFSNAIHYITSKFKTILDDNSLVNTMC